MRTSSRSKFLSKREENSQIAWEHRADKPLVAFNRGAEFLILLRAQAVPAKHSRNMGVAHVLNLLQKISRHQSCAWRRRADRQNASRLTMLTTFSHFALRSSRPVKYPRNVRVPLVLKFLHKL